MVKRLLPSASRLCNSAPRVCISSPPAAPPLRPQTPVRAAWAGGLLAALAVAGTIYLSYRFAAGILRRLGETGTDVFMRLSAFILLCLGVQILTNGIAGLPFFAAP